jgi:nitrate/nitrite-specific signal transduction histidine kinase
MSLSRLQWVVVALAALFVLLTVLVGFLAQRFGPLGSDGRHALQAALVLVGVVPFTLFIFRGIIGPMYRQIEAQNRELRLMNAAAGRRNDQMRAIQEAGFTLTSELSLDIVLQAVVDLSRALVGARSGVLEYPGSGEAQTRRFVSGSEGSDDVAADEADRQHLTLPLEYKGTAIARLRLDGKADDTPYGEEEEGLLNMFATQAAIAIENARLYEQVQELAVVRERERIARELHDNFAQTLGYFNTKIQAVRELLAGGKADAAMTQAEQLEKAARGLYGDVREAIESLWSSTSLREGLEAALTEYLQRFEQRTGIETELTQDGSMAYFRNQSREAVEVFRVIQEALTNVRKHAEASKASVRFSRGDAHVELCVEDDGHGFAPEESVDGERFGLKVMRERARSIQAELELDSEPGAGTRVRLRVPTAPSGGRARGRKGSDESPRSR